MEIKVRVGGENVAIRENLIDRAIAYVDPIRAQRRFAARAMRAIAGGYVGGRTDKRSLSSWTARARSANADLLPDLETLRSRSRDLVRNEPLAAGAISTVTTNVVGTGLMLKSRVLREVLGWTEEEAAAWQRNTEYEFRHWFETTNCDVTRTQNGYGLQDLALRSTLENGDSLAALPYVSNPRSPYRLAVQMIEADRLCNKDRARDTLALAGGVQMDQYGAAIAYHVQDQHPGELLGGVKSTWTILPAFGSKTGRRNVLHLFERKRIGQARGIPYLSPVIETFKQLGRYTEAEVTAAVLAAMIAIETKTEDRQGLSPLESAVTGATPSSGASDPAKGSSWDGTLTPGLAVDMGLNESIATFKTDGRPNPQFDPFTTAVLRQVGVALELPFEVLVKHFTASYSAARSALLEAWKFYRGRRAWLATYFCQPIYEAWMEEAVALGRVPAPGFFDDPVLRCAYLGSEWHGDGPGSIDPLKEALAAEKRLEINLTTLALEQAEYNGADFDTTIEQRGREVKKLKGAGLAPAQEGGTSSGDPAGGGTQDEEEGKPPPAESSARRAFWRALTSRLI